MAQWPALKELGETDAEAEVMERHERSILAGLGFPDPYEVDHGDAA